ncbi:hypothetical protein NKG05_13295 [Oerskovia sp. M15]
MPLQVRRLIGSSSPNETRCPMELAPYLIAGVLAVVGVTALAPRLGSPPR